MPLPSIFLLVRSPTHDESIPAAAAVAASTNATDPTLPPWLPLERPDPSEWNGGSVIPVAVVSAAVAIILVALRFYTRARILRTVMWDDWFILASLVFAIATSGGMIAQLNFGLGQHLYFAWPSFPLYIQAGTFTNLSYSLSLTLTKISILLLYIRILHTYDLVRAVGKALLALVAVSHAWIVASILTTCVPLRAAWDFDAVPGAYCHPAAVFWGNACLHLATDVLIFLLPLPVIAGMRLPRRQKLGLFCVFCLAFLVCGISIIRLARLLHLDESPEEVMDITWSAVRIANWTCVEVHAAIATSCLTTLKPLLSLLFPSFMAAGDTPPSTATAAESRRRQKEWEDNFSTGGAEATYRRPLTIGTKTDRPRRQRDTFASLVFGDVKHVEDGAGAGPKRGSEYRLAEVEAAGPMQWPFGRVSFGRMSFSVRGSRVPAPPMPQVPPPHSGRATRGSAVAAIPERRSESVERHGSPAEVHEMV